MSIDIASTLVNLITLVSIAIIIFGGYRAIELSRVLVGRVYRNRAYWTLGLIGLVVFFVGVQYVPDSTGLVSAFGFFGITFALFLFVDSNIHVVKEMDFFHREILRWGTFRKPILASLICTSVIAIFSLIYYPGGTFGSSIWATLGVLSYFVVLAVAFSYSAAGLIVSARRTPDASMRRFVRMLAFSLVSFALFFTTWIPLGVFGTAVENVGSTIFVIPAAYFIYRAVMSLSPVGRVEKGAVESITPV